MLESVKGAEVYEQATDIAVILALARHVSQKAFIDVGAEKGTVSRAFFEIGFKGVLFEPFPAHLPVLQRLVEGTESRVFGFAIDETDREGTLHVAVDEEGKERDHFHSLRRIDAHPFVKHARALPIQCRSLASLASEGLISQEVGILKVDTEGCDLNVLRGMGDVRAEVLVCEFVTPSLYSTWSGSFPEPLMEAAKERGYQACVAVKRMAGHELVVFDPQGFVDGQWGNLVFTSRKLLDCARSEISRIAYESEKALANVIRQHAEALEAKEAVIRELAAACEARLAAIHTLTAELERLKAKAGDLRNR